MLALTSELTFILEFPFTLEVAVPPIAAANPPAVTPAALAGPFIFKFVFPLIIVSALPSNFRSKIILADIFFAEIAALPAVAPNTFPLLIVTEVFPVLSNPIKSAGLFALLPHAPKAKSPPTNPNIKGDSLEPFFQLL